jgi:thioredoxin 1
MRFLGLLALALLAGCARRDRGPAATVDLAPAAGATDASFKAEIEDGQGVAVVDFNARWCGPCRRMSPVIDAVAADCKGRATVMKLDVDAAAQTAERYDVHSIPCLIVFRNGKEVVRHYGLHEKAEVETWIASARGE